MRITLETVELEPRMEGSRLILGLGEAQRIVVAVSAEDCEASQVELMADWKHLQLEEGAESVSLGSGSFRKIVEWRLGAVAPGDGLSIDVVATADGQQQRSMFPMSIRPLPRIED
jgi:hypothetical protein